MENAPLETWTVAIDADTSGLEDQLKQVQLSGRQFSASLTTALDGLVLKGKSLNDVFATLALSLSKMVLNAAFKPLTDGLGSIVTGLFGSGSSLSTGSALATGLPSPFASNGLIQSPAAFPVSAGQAGRVAATIAPLAGGTDARSGVAPAASGMNVTFNVQATDAESFARSQTQIAAMLSRTVALGQRNL